MLTWRGSAALWIHLMQSFFWTLTRCDFHKGVITKCVDVVFCAVCRELQLDAGEVRSHGSVSNASEAKLILWLVVELLKVRAPYGVWFVEATCLYAFICLVVFLCVSCVCSHCKNAWYLSSLLSVCLYSMSVCACVHLFVFLFVCLSVCPSFHPIVCLVISPSLCLPFCLPACASVCLSDYLSHIYSMSVCCKCLGHWFPQMAAILATFLV